MGAKEDILNGANATIALYRERCEGLEKRLAALEETANSGIERLKEEEMKIGDLIRPAIAAHLLVRRDNILCTRCYRSEPVHPGDGTPMTSLVMAYATITRRHQNCEERIK